MSHGGGRQAYFAMARVIRVEADPDTQDHYYAYLDGFLEFDNSVAFQGGQGDSLLILESNSFDVDFTNISLK
jgi:putative restriction endonuclease